METSQYQELFLSESQEILTALNKALIYLEKHPSDQPCFEEIFRHCHTLKGMAATMDYHQIVEISHAMENILDKIRKEKKPIDKYIVSSLFKGLDFLEALFAVIQRGKKSKIKTKPMVEYLVNILQEINVESSEELEKKATKTKKEKKKIVSTNKNQLLPNKEMASNVSTQLSSLTSASSVRVSIERLEALVNAVGELITNKIRLSELSKVLNNKILSEAVADLNRISSRIQDETMQIRLLPLDYLLRHFPRMIRDDAYKEGKEVNLIITGSDIGVDRRPFYFTQNQSRNICFKCRTTTITTSG